MVLRKPDGKRRTLRIPRTVYLRVIGKLTVRRPANLGSFGRISQSDAHFHEHYCRATRNDFHGRSSMLTNG